jgi:large subunit ribosomal protein L17e
MCHLLLFPSGRWPEKSCKYITRLLKNAEANADAKSLELEDLTIRSIVVQQAPVCLAVTS